MAATEGNDYAVKEAKGKPMSLYLPANALPAIEKKRRERGEEDLSETACRSEAREYALEGIKDRIGPAPMLDQLRYLVSNWQALSNHAEMFAPELRDNLQWIAIKVSLEQQNDQLGVTELVRQTAERYQERIERFL